MSEHLKQLLSAFGKRLGVDLFSFDFVRDPSYVQDRCARMLGGSEGARSLLRCLLHSGLTGDERRSIFPGKFDLGNAQPIPFKECTYEALGKELDEQRSREQVLDNPLIKAEVVRLLKDVSLLLGHEAPQEAQPGVDKIFKVAKLLHSFKQRQGLSQLFSILRPPTEGNASLEFNNPYPTGVDSDLRWHINDLHAYLSVEIASDRLAEIDSTFGEIRSVLDETSSEVQLVFKRTSATSYDEIVQRYEVALEQWATRRTPPARQILKADEQLYVAIHVLDFLHFDQVERQLRSKKLMQRSVAPVPMKSLRFRLRLQNLLEWPAPEEVKRLHSLLNEALGEQVSLRQYKNYIVRAHVLLEHWVAMLEAPPRDDVDALTCLAAIVVARELLEQAPLYKPRLHGAARGQSHSVKAAMRADRPVSSTHEEFERIVSYAIQWTRYSLGGQTAVLEAQLAFEMRLQEMAVMVLNTHDTQVVANFIENLKNYSYYVAQTVPEVVSRRRGMRTAETTSELHSPSG